MADPRAGRAPGRPDPVHPRLAVRRGDRGRRRLRHRLRCHDRARRVDGAAGGGPSGAPGERRGQDPLPGPDGGAAARRGHRRGAAALGGHRGLAAVPGPTRSRRVTDPVHRRVAGRLRGPDGGVAGDRGTGRRGRRLRRGRRRRLLVDPVDRGDGPGGVGRRHRGGRAEPAAADCRTVKLGRLRERPRLRLRTAGWSLRRRAVVGFAALGLAFVGLIAALVLSLVDFVQKGNEVVYRWQPAAAASQDLLADLVNQETGVRGFAISGKQEFLQPFEQYSAKQRADTARLHQLLDPYPVLRTNLQTFTAIATAWQDTTAVPLISLVNAHNPSALRLLDDPVSKAHFDLVRKSAATLMDSVDAVTRAALADRKGGITGLVAALATSAAVIVLFGLAVWRGLYRWVLVPVETLAAQTREVAEGANRRAIRPSGPPELVDLGTDVETMRRRIVDELARIERAGDDLARSNADLAQFAYVASHDLSEPLRKVANFCQLLERQYGDQLDDTARSYIAFAVDGAKRMQTLIADLLRLSRVGRSTEGFVAVDLNVVMDRVRENLADQIAATGGGVGVSELPTVSGDPLLLASLLENLVGNALKYRSEQPPLIVVTSAPDRAHRAWTFAVRDNGIGIDARHAERVFAIFQRLHVREQYPGTGIGLALCRRIVEFHGGRIWLDTAPGPGATFRFTLPEGPVP
ncbi:MAG: HAMP domain-containing protein [Jatrophihabitans sp.]|nr:MAG: HAMP domain-containing protein [Jatrophihabitans sp.]